jgi:DNA-binding MarR family transcriptional regulator
MSTPPLPTGFDDTRVNRVANRLHSATIHFLRRVRAVDRTAGLTPERLSLLSILAFAGPRTVSQLAEAEMISRPAISRTLNSLEAAGLARRARSDEDRRVVRVYATEKGRRLIEDGRRRRLEHVARELSGLTAKELSILEAASELLESLEGRR